MPSAAFAFVDPISKRECDLVLIHGEPPTVSHPDCDERADVSIEGDAFYCVKCRMSGRISGYWVVDMIDRHMRPRKPVPQRLPDISYVHGLGSDFDDEEPF